MVLSWTVGQLQ